MGGDSKTVPIKSNKFLVIDDDCDRPACDDVTSMMKKAVQIAASSSNASSQSLSPSEVTTKTTTTIHEVNNISCPPTGTKIGNSSWDLLHSMVAWYPEKPTNTDKEQITNFFTALGRFYPCSWCAADFQEKLIDKPIQTDSRIELCQWLCEQHNAVNEKLGKEMFSCDMKTLDERWRKNTTNPDCVRTKDH